MSSVNLGHLVHAALSMGKLVSYPPTALEEAHEADVSPNGRREVKYPFAFKGLDWEAYHCFRPVYPDSMFNMWSVFPVTYSPILSGVTSTPCDSFKSLLERKLGGHGAKPEYTRVLQLADLEHRKLLNKYIPEIRY